MTLLDAVANVADLLWGGAWQGKQVLPAPPMVMFLLGTGLYLMLRLRGRPLLGLLSAARLAWEGRRGNGAGELPPLKALVTALAGQLGVGKIVGVATAISLGGPGAVFWMWVTALLGTALAFAESSLAVKLRETSANGALQGGPMVYIRLGLGARWRWLALLFSIGTVVAALGAPALIQSNALVTAVTSSAHGIGMPLPATVPSLILAVLVFCVVIGGLRKISTLAQWLMPLMALAYVAACLVVLALHAQYLPQAFGRIFAGAFGLAPVLGGAVGTGIIAAMRAGVARGLMSNEAGQGTTPIVHATAQTDDPAKQGTLATLGVFVDTIMICTMTALVILSVPGHYATQGGFVPFAWMSPLLQGGALTAAAFDAGIPGGRWIVTGAILLFAFSTLTTWHYYAERALVDLLGSRMAIPFRLLWVVAVFIGGLQPIERVWRIGDLAIAMMTIPNIIALIVLTPVVVGISRVAVPRSPVPSALATEG